MDRNPLTITTPTDREVVLTRDFDAEPALVFEALTKPDILKLWYLPEGWSFDVCEIDLRVGGKWHFVSRQPNGKVIGQLGVFQEIQRNKRLVNTESWEDWVAGETLVTRVLVDHHGRTTFTSTILFPSREVRDTVMKSGLAKTVGPVYDKLAEVLMSIKSSVDRRSHA
jgi:uncharacterized protein YndB with AHSA1/START domain